MATPKVRADYDVLKDVAARFGGQAQTTRQTLQTLQGHIDGLAGGDWVGQGATAFFQEMSGQVLPSLKRLAGALESAQQSTLQISQIMQQAEVDAARVLRGPGGSASAGRAAGPAMAAGPGGAATPAEIGAAANQIVTNMTNAFGGSKDMEAAASRGVAAAAAGTPPAVNAAITRALEEGAVDRKLSMFTPKVRDLVKQSPTLRADILKLEQSGYTFQTGAVADGYYTDWDHNTIVIDQPLSDADTVSHIAHEGSHGASNQVRKIPATATTTRDQYADRNTDNLMRNEGEAQFTAAQVRAELKAAGGPDTGIPGIQPAAYQQVYDDFSAGNITQAQAIDQMGTLMANEHVSIPPYQAYRDYYRDTFLKDFDDNIAPTRRP